MWAHGPKGDVEPEAAPVRLPEKILLSWYGEQLSAHPGERWLFVVRLKRPHGHFNPHGFDYEAWLTERGIGATGYAAPKDRCVACHSSASGQGHPNNPGECLSCHAPHKFAK